MPERHAAVQVQRDVRDVAGSEQLVNRFEVARIEHLLHEPADDDLEDVRGHGALSPRRLPGSLRDRSMASLPVVFVRRGPPREVLLDPG